jgi:hypothetical protein
MIGILFKNHTIYFFKKMYGGLVAEPKGQKVGHTPRGPPSSPKQRQGGEAARGRATLEIW